MAKFNVVGLDDVQEAMLRQDAIVEEAVPEMLKAGGAVMQKAQQEEIKTRFNSRRSTGALLASIKVSAVKEIDGGKRVEIYPNGKDKHGVRNAEKGFVLNYGRSNMPARPWFTAANEKAADDVVSEMRRVWEETLFVLSERLTRNEIIIKMPDQTAASVVAALNKLERRFGKKFSQIFKSITFDNGSEFMDCAGIEKSVYGKDRKRTKVYYCHPYSAYERGTNENINKMIRRFLPKGTDFRKVTAAYIQRVETWINNYPREILGFETSGSLFERYVAEAA